MPAREVPPDLKKYMGKRLSVKLNGSRRVVGRLSGFDVFMNLVLEEASEVRGGAGAGGAGGAGEEVPMGILIVRGNSVVQMECLEA
jgi:small nuclear ribonucleoprotein G